MRLTRCAVLLNHCRVSSQEEVKEEEPVVAAPVAAPTPKPAAKTRAVAAAVSAPSAAVSYLPPNWVVNWMIATTVIVCWDSSYQLLQPWSVSDAPLGAFSWRWGDSEVSSPFQECATKPRRR